MEPAEIIARAWHAKLVEQCPEGAVEPFGRLPRNEGDRIIARAKAALKALEEAGWSVVDESEYLKNMIADIPPDDVPTRIKLPRK